MDSLSSFFSDKEMYDCLDSAHLLYPLDDGSVLDVDGGVRHLPVPPLPAITEYTHTQVLLESKPITRFDIQT